MQFYQADEKEIKMVTAGGEILDIISTQRSEFYDGAYECGVLADIIYESGRTPLSNAMTQEIYRDSYKQIIDAFVVSGTFESYITVFKKIFGDDVDITFTVPAPGKLNIDIIAAGVELSPWVAKTIVDNIYVYDNMVDHEGNRLVFQTIKGFETQYELEQMLRELVPAGIYTEITLDLLGD